MSDPHITLSDTIADYQKPRTEILSLVNAVSMQANVQAGIGLEIPCENHPSGAKALHIPCVTALEIAQGGLDEAQLSARIREILSSTAVRYTPKKNEVTYLNPNSPYFASAVQRLVMMMGVASQNFARELAQLVTLYDGLTVTGAPKPSFSAYHAKAAFNYPEILDAYRLTHAIAKSDAPSLTAENRKLLQKFGISSEAIPDRVAATSFAQVATYTLPAAPAALQAANKVNPVQVMVDALWAAQQRGECSQVVISDALLTALANALQNHTVAPDKRPHLARS